MFAPTLTRITQNAAKCLCNITNLKRYATALRPKQYVSYEKLQNNDEGIAVLGLNSPKNRNALSKQMLYEFNETLDQVNRDSSIRTLVIRSLVSGVFCAGADLKERANMSEKEVALFVPLLRSLTKTIYDVPVPVIAAIEGVALGGGFELALACDIRVASSETRLGLVETKLAIIPGAGGTQYLPRLINPSIAKELIFSARILNAIEAKSIGVVNHVVEQNSNGDSAYLKSLEIARQIARNGPVAVKMAKKAINKGLEASLDTGLVAEEACYARVINTSDRTEGLEAFKEKRTPRYKGE